MEAALVSSICAGGCCGSKLSCARISALIASMFAVWEVFMEVAPVRMEGLGGPVSADAVEALQTKVGGRYRKRGAVFLAVVPQRPAGGAV